MHRRPRKWNSLRKSIGQASAGLALVLALVLALLASGAALAAGCDRFWSERGAAADAPTVTGATN